MPGIGALSANGGRLDVVSYRFPMFEVAGGVELVPKALATKLATSAAASIPYKYKYSNINPNGETETYPKSIRQI